MPKTAVEPSRTGVAPWPAEAAARYVANGYWEGRSLGSHLADAARKTPDAICLVDGQTRISFGELLARADGAAARMRELGVGPDDRVVVQLPNCWEHVVISVACLRLGALPVWALPQHRMHELSGVVAHAEARAIVVPDTYKGFDHQALAHEVVGLVPSAEHVFVTGTDIRDDSVNLRDLLAPAENPGELATAFDAAAPAGDAIAMFLLSGGTTGLPKLVARTHNDLTYMIKRAIELCGYGPDTVYMATLPLGHGFPNTGPGVIGALLAGGRVVIASSPAPELALALIEQEGVTTTSAVPAIVQRWMRHHEEHPGTDLSSLDVVQVGAARLSAEDAEEIGPKLGCRLQQVFGMGEGLLCVTRLDDPPEIVNHTQGRPISEDDELRVIDEEGRPVPPGEPGVLLVRGPYTPRSYYRSPEIDARSFVDDGWYHTGDIVRRTPDGYLIITGREKDLINRGGEKISAEEIETFALQLDGVTHAAAVAMPDRELGEQVCLFVVVTEGTKVELADVWSVMIAAESAKFKLPARLVTIDALPLTPIGKVDKKALRADIARAGG
ncbi:(2,3-dihydroxybenzoyl)adenylate synthase [Amycolatopsis regifaucium]|uniref:2,3-dihydroxybenzoate-AMP ligase n=1 Tax=Amycolatopsis regifaucium TaxID=546365 RepID=A0A154MT65_9PSEU|nr:AMP-binding protein [Amycolatopsis regifaucium]KZB87455.1 2,3-dihydroxybenzoate-AMP ligase [Amycolatopsis regifaucium]OKA08293.1 2,3-dihydroxybenzoate-AMP ligase [Amycolatopsis regifaucium]SFI05711.1 2,3-dihydroxybenzoate-AMP ligase [Amycolatopsis regifaucium]